MNRLSAVLVAVLVASFQAMGQEAAVASKVPKVEQGERITLFTVKVSPAPNVAGSVSVTSTLESDPSQTLTGGSGLNREQTSVDVQYIIHTDTKTGVWKVVRVFFEPENSPAVDLKFTGSPKFEVVERKITLPTTADVEVK
jgi:hypothetical protein